MQDPDSWLYRDYEIKMLIQKQYENWFEQCEERLLEEFLELYPDLTEDMNTWDKADKESWNTFVSNSWEREKDGI